jgi:hypothetical protein
VVKKLKVNVAPIDVFTIPHFLFGVIFAMFGVSLVTVVLLALGFELFENVFKDTWSWLFPNASHDSFLNTTFDIIALIIGWYVVEVFF